MGPDRLSPLDASFLHIEDHVSHMHIASVAIFEGPPPPFGDIVAMVEAKLDLVPRYRQKVRFVPFELGRPVWVDDPHFNIEYHLRHTALPSPGGESELRKLVGPRHGPAAGPLQAVVGDLGGRGARGRTLGDAGQDAPRAGRRRLGHRPAGGDHGPQPARPSARSRRSGRPARSPRGSSSWSTRWRTSCSRPTSRCGRHGRRRGRSAAWRATCSRSPVASSRSAGSCARPRSRASTARSARTGATPGPPRRSTTSSGCARRSAGPSTTWCWPASPTGSASCCSRAARTSSGSCAPWCPCRSARATRRARRSATARTRTGSPPCSPSCRSTSTTPPCASTSSPSR